MENTSKIVGPGLEVFEAGLRQTWRYTHTPYPPMGLITEYDNLPSPPLMTALFLTYLNLLETPFYFFK